MRYLAAVIGLLLSALPELYSQQPESESLPGDLYLKVRSLNFLKNNEYFNPITVSPFNLTGNLPLPVDKSLWIEGYTLTGFFLRPELVYRATEKITVTTGIHLLKYSGMEKFAEIRPAVSASLSLGKNTTLTLGALDGSEKHLMFDPHFDRERMYNSNIEEGLQLRTTGEHLFNDTWIDWENYIFPGDTAREVFTFGESFSWTTAPIADMFKVSFPVQLQFRHYGGQISNYPEKVTTFFNLAGGIRFDLEPASVRFGKAGLEYLYFINSIIPPRKDEILTHGDALWIRLHYYYKSLYAGLYYWNASDFFAPLGNSIYASVYKFDSGYVIHSREMLTGAVYLNILPEKWFGLMFGIETYYDLNTKHLDYSMTLHLDFNKMFGIANLR